MTIEDQINQFKQSAEAFADCIKSLSDAAFLQTIDKWSPRDILAHLIGWNLFTIKGSEQVRNGELPFYFDDPGEDFAKINALLLQRHPSQDRQKLLDELQSSTQELMRYLMSLDPDDWDRDFGVRYQGWAITVRNSVDALRQDYVNHQDQINAWVEGLDGKNKNSRDMA
jgi:hypothetical protein